MGSRVSPTGGVSEGGAVESQVASPGWKFWPAEHARLTFASIKAGSAAPSTGSNWRKVKQVIKKSDQYPYIPVVQLEGKSSYVGGFLYIASVAAIVVYMIVTWTRFLAAPVPKSLIEGLADSQGVFVPNVGFEFVMANGSVLNDPSYFTFQSNYVTISNSDITTKAKTKLAFGTCSYVRDSDSGVLLRTGVTCVKPTAGQNLSGWFEAATYKYMELNLNPCTQGRCQDAATVGSMLSGGQVNVMWDNINVRDVTGDHPTLFTSTAFRSIRYYFTWYQVAHIEIYMTKKSVTHISSWPLGKDDFQTGQTDGYQISTLQSYPSTNGLVQTSPNATSYIKLIWRLNPLMTVETWTAQGILDLLGSWGAFWSFLGLFLGTMAVFWNHQLWIYANMAYDHVSDEEKSRREKERKQQNQPAELKIMMKEVAKVASKNVVAQDTRTNNNDSVVEIRTRD